MDIKIVQMGKKIVQMDKKIVQMNIKIVQIDIKIEPINFVWTLFILQQISHGHGAQRLPP